MLCWLQVAESSKIHAEDKEAEVKLLERSVEELECTINVLENKVSLPTFYNILQVVFLPSVSITPYESFC